MSKRFDWLAVEAGLIASVYNGFDRARLTKAEIKFAELVIRECARFIDKHEQVDKYGEAHEVVHGSDLLKHFGIEDE